MIQITASTATVYDSDYSTATVYDSDYSTATVYDSDYSTATVYDSDYSTATVYDSDYSTATLLIVVCGVIFGVILLIVAIGVSMLLLAHNNRSAEGQYVRESLEFNAAQVTLVGHSRAIYRS